MQVLFIPLSNQKGITTFEIEEDSAETERSDEQKQKEEETHKELKKQQKTADPGI